LSQTADTLSTPLLYTLGLRAVIGLIFLLVVQSIQAVKNKNCPEVRGL
jgi:hypothetical protein